MIVYVENPRELKKKKNLSRLIGEFSKVVGYKINIQKSTIFLCNNSEQLDTKDKDTIPFIITQKFKCLGINLTKHV